MLTQERRPNSEPSMPPPTVVRLYSGELYVSMRGLAWG